VQSEQHPLDTHFVDSVASLNAGAARPGDAAITPGSDLTVALTERLFLAQCESRHADFAAKWMQTQSRGFYTIGSSGHEGNAGVAAALRPDDPVLLHYRSGAFYCARAHQMPGHDGPGDIVLGVAAAVTEPIAGGRHKVFGNHELSVIPQTSTIASHLPRAMGLGFALERAKRLGLASPWPRDAVVMTSFGDASANHSTLIGALNTASNVVFQGLNLPVLFVCEDNGIGISTRTPKRWIEERFSAMPGIRYVGADGSDISTVYDAATQAVSIVRERRQPVFLHLRMVRFMGHAGSDAEIAYRSKAEIAADYERDPLVATARLLAAAGVADGAELVRRYEQVRDRVHLLAVAAMEVPQLATAAEVVAPLALRHSDRIAAAVCDVDTAERPAVFGGRPPEGEGPLTLALAINRALADELARHPEALLFGEDVSVKGGVYGVTRGLRKAFGGARVWDTLLDEQSILGVALGAALSGMLPIPEIQYLAYVHNALDQLRGEAATLQFFSQGQYRNPMVVRIAGLGYQKGFGGHFHNDNSVAALLDLPGVVVAVPSHPSDAPALLRTLTAAASTDGTVGIFLEPIALYHQRDLLEEGDGGWLAPYRPPAEWAADHVEIGRARTWLDGRDLTIATFGNGLPMSLRVANQLAAEGISARVLDLRWLSPLPTADLLREASETGRVLVVDETRRSGGVSERVVTALVDQGFRGVIRRVTSADSFIPLGDAARLVLLDEQTVLDVARGLVRGG